MPGVFRANLLNDSVRLIDDGRFLPLASPSADFSVSLSHPDLAQGARRVAERTDLLIFCLCAERAVATLSSVIGIRCASLRRKQKDRRAGKRFHPKPLPELKGDALLPGINHT